MYRVFRDHAGRWHRVRMSRDEINERIMYWVSIPAVSIAMMIGMCIAAGII